MRKVLFVLALLFAFCVSSFSAFACSCIMPGTVTEEVERADVVFVGTVIAVDHSEYRAYIFPDLEFSFTVQEYWKGVLSEPLIIHTGQGGGDCGFSFEEGKSYLVYAYADESGDLHTNICSRTALLSDAEGDLVRLGNGFAPIETIVGYNYSEENIFNILVFVLILLLISFVIFSSYKKNKK
ncbi:hypothetical protein HZC31_00160 [Candidatus Woesearchaeota archaeon]|nr:hypothetical protein [Candidatus Woesearchaeota archaeon]